MNARVIIGEQHIGDATNEERDAFAWALAGEMETQFPGLSVDYNPLSATGYEWQAVEAEEYWDDEKVEEFTTEVVDWVERNWEQVLEDVMATA